MSEYQYYDFYTIDRPLTESECEKIRRLLRFIKISGDFGFYDEQSLTRLSPRELRLLVSHSPFWRQHKLGHLSEEALLAYEIIKREVPKKDDWFKKMWNINLPDAKDGHAALAVEDGRFSLETYSNGVRV